jgi:serine/threonine-protein kinase
MTDDPAPLSPSRSAPSQDVVTVAHGATATTPVLGAIEHFNLLERLDPAGPGELYRARDTRLGRTVAVRVLPAAFMADDSARDRLLANARALVGFSHPNITTLFAAGEHDGRIYLAFEFVAGRPLRAEMGGQPMNVRRAVDLATQIVDAVAAAHAAGFVHGGLSPDSIVVTSRGHAKIPAFELATRAGFDPASPEARLRDYDSPEEARGQDADERSDLYSAGAVLYEMLTTRRPSHRGASAPGASNAQVTPELDEIVLKAVSPNPERRYHSAAALAADLRVFSAVVDARAVANASAAAATQNAPHAGRAVTIAALIVAAVALLAWWIMRS